MLIDLSGGEEQPILPASTLNAYVKAWKKENQGKQGDRILKFMNGGIDDLKSEPVVFTGAGIMWGDNSDRPFVHHEALWDSINRIVGGGKDSAIMLGCLFRHVMSNRPEKHWMCLTQNTGLKDPITDKPINRTKYWLDLNFKYPKFTTQDLLSKFNKRA